MEPENHRFLLTNHNPNFVIHHVNTACARISPIALRN